MKLKFQVAWHKSFILVVLIVSLNYDMFVGELLVGLAIDLVGCEACDETQSAVRLLTLHSVMSYLQIYESLVNGCSTGCL